MLDQVSVHSSEITVGRSHGMNLKRITAQQRQILTQEFSFPLVPRSTFQSCGWWCTKGKGKVNGRHQWSINWDSLSTDLKDDRGPVQQTGWTQMHEERRERITKGNANRILDTNRLSPLPRTWNLASVTWDLSSFLWLFSSVEDWRYQGNERPSV